MHTGDRAQHSGCLTPSEDHKSTFAALYVSLSYAVLAASSPGHFAVTSRLKLELELDWETPFSPMQDSHLLAV